MGAVSYERGTPVNAGADGARILVGDNTDWVAIHRLVEDKVASNTL